MDTLLSPAAGSCCRHWAPRHWSPGAATRRRRRAARRRSRASVATRWGPRTPSSSPGRGSRRRPPRRRSSASRPRSRTSSRRCRPTTTRSSSPRFNRHPAHAPFAMSDETFTVFARAGEVSAALKARSTSRSRRCSCTGLRARKGAACRDGRIVAGAAGARRMATAGARRARTHGGKGACRTSAPTCPGSPKATASIARRKPSIRSGSPTT